MPSGLLILSVINTGDDTNFLVTFSATPNDSGGVNAAELEIDGAAADTAFLDTGNTWNFQMASSVSPNAAWEAVGPIFPASPVLYPQNGTY